MCAKYMSLCSFIDTIYSVLTNFPSNLKGDKISLRGRGKFLIWIELYVCICTTTSKM